MNGRAARGALLVLALATACATEQPKAPPASRPSPTNSAPRTERDPVVAALHACFEARDPAERTKRLAALDAFAVPRDARERARILREALGAPARGGSARVAEKQGDPPLDCITATPAVYSPLASYPVVLPLNAYATSAEQNLAVFAKGGVFSWEDGLVLAPAVHVTGDNAESFSDARARVLAAIARANRSFGLDPDRLVIAGMSMGGALGYDLIARHPDRFAGLACVSGGMPQQPTPLPNLRTVKVYIQHGDADDQVGLYVAKENDARLKELGVEHVFDVLKGGLHAWPTQAADAARVAEWLRAQRRDAWPRELDLVFPAYPDSKDPKRRIYWLEVPPQNKNRRVTASAKDNVIELGQLLEFKSVVLHLGEPLVDLDREVVVRFEGKQLFRGKLARSWRTLVEDLETDGWDTTRAAPARLEVSLGP